MDIVVATVAVAGLTVAILSLVLTWRITAEGGRDHVGRARRDVQERQLRQLSNRLEAVEYGNAGHPPGQPAGSPDAGTSATPPTAAISRIGLVRFDAFEDAGGAQSFAVALLDDAGDGIVLTSLHSRPTTRVYLKAIRGGSADAPLSDEEKRAMYEAGIRTATA